MADNKISPLYTNLIDYLDTYNASVYKHHKTGNVIHLWVKQTKFNYDFDRDIKKAVYDYFKDIIGFFLPGNVKIDNMTQEEFKRREKESGIEKYYKTAMKPEEKAIVLNDSS